MPFTRGPWTYDRKTDQVDCPGGTICHGIGWAANGPLIAAAPDLFAALDRIISLMETVGGELDTPAARAAHAALRKARGEER